MATENGAGLRLLLEQFGVAVRAPADVARLKQLILQLAVRGRLVSQDVNDEPAGVLLAQINHIKQGLIDSGKLRDKTDLPQLNPDERRYDLPSSWAWVRLGELGQIIGGGTPRTGVAEYWADYGIPWLTPADLYALTTKTIGKGRRYISQAGLENSSAQLLPAGAVLFSSRAPIGYVAIAENDLATNQGFKSCVAYVIEMNHYLYYLLKAEGKRIDEEASGTTFKEVSGKDVMRIPVPLPPLAEQHRIVARVDELMAQADELAGRLAAAAGERRRFHTAALARLTAAPSAAGIAPAPPLPGSPAPLSPRPPAPSPWTLLEPHFHRLYADPAAVAELKAAVLQLAVMGRLVENSEVESIKTTVDELCEVRGGIQKSPGRRPSNHPTRYLTVAHVGWGSIDTGDPRYFEVSDEELERWRLLPGDVLVVEGNGSMSQIGRTAVFRGEIENCVHQNHVIRVRPDKRRLLPEYLNLCFMSPQGRQHMIQRSQTSSGLYTLSTGRLKTVELTVPPLAEQHRIVARVDELFALADEAAGRGAAAEGARGRWAEQIMNQEKP